METLVYTLTFIPIIIIVLTVHEAGHFLVAKLLKVKATRFQIGIGPTILSRHTGRTTYSFIQPHIPAPRPMPGDKVILLLKDDVTDQNQHAVLEWTLQTAPSHVISEMSNKGPCITAEVIHTDHNSISVKDTNFSVKSIPIMALVHLAEDPTASHKGFINTSSWLTKMAIIVAGVGANLALLSLVILAIAIAPIAQPGQPVVSITAVNPGTPAELAGMTPGDIIIKADDHLWPTPTQFKTAIDGAHFHNKTLNLSVKRNDSIVQLVIRPDSVMGTIGVMIAPAVIAGDQGTTITDRFKQISLTYFTSLAALVNPPETTNAQSERRFTGVISAAQYTGEAVKTAKYRAWLAMLGIITLSMAIINILPIPPLDGFQIVNHTIQSIRKGKALNPKFENALTLTGLSAIAGLATYLAIQDLLHIAGG